MSALKQRYDIWDDDIDLVRIRTRPADEEIRGLCKRFVKMSVEERELLRNTLTDEELYIVWAFSNRCVAFAVRDRECSPLSDGLTAYAMLTYDRMDYRDLDIADLMYGAQRIGCDLAADVERAASLAEPKMRNMLRNRHRVLSGKKDLGTLLVEIQTESGPRLIGRDLDPYHPSRPLEQGILSLAELVMKEGYKPSSLSIATSLPAVWFRDEGDPQLQKILKSTLGCGSLSGSLYPGVRPEFELQELLVWLLEVPEPGDAAALVDKARQRGRESMVILPVHDGPLFCLVVAKSMRSGVSSHETPESMSRFSEPIRSILSRVNQRA
jgi:hypothetical protein